MAKIGFASIEAFARKHPSGNVVVIFDPDSGFWKISPFGEERTLARYLHRKHAWEALRKVGFCQQTMQLWQLINLKKKDRYSTSATSLVRLSDPT